MTGPLYVMYDIDNYYQNHRKYVANRSPLQLQGQYQTEPELTGYCDGLMKNGTKLLNPCGLIANSFFNGMFC